MVIPGPGGLSDAALTFWESVTAEFDFAPHELRLLLDVCKTIEVIDRLSVELDRSEIVVTGSTGQPVVHPLVPEIRQHRAALSSLMLKLKLPVEDEDPDSPGAQSAAARSLANKRWNGG